MDGRVVGVTTGVVGGTGLGVVVPDRLVADVVDRLQRDGAVRHSWSGLGVADDAGSGRGGAVKITALATVQAEPPLRVGDLIVTLDGKRLLGARDFQWREFSGEPGTTWRLDVVRGKDQIVVPLTLQPLTQEAFARRATAPPSL
jgi:S1-C subfamily serine protease